MGDASHGTAHVFSQVVLEFLGWTQSLDTSSPHCMDVAKASEPLC